MALQNIVETGKPKGHGWRYVRPAQGVYLDLATLFRLPPHHEHAPVVGGLQLRRSVAATLSIWAPSREGDWFGLVTYDVAGPGSAVSHWAPAWSIRADPTRRVAEPPPF